MTDSADAIRAEIAACRDAAAGAQARLAQIDAELAALADERLTVMDEPRRWGVRINALERALAVLVEHSAPEPVEADPVPTALDRMGVSTGPDEPDVLVTPSRQRVRDELHAISRARTEALEDHRSPSRRVDPLTVIPRPHSPGASAKKTAYRAADDGAHPELDVERLSVFWSERADLLFEVLLDADGSMSQDAMTHVMADLLGCPRPTASSIVSRVVTILFRQGRIMNTGQKSECADGRVRSVIWKIVRGKP